MGRMDPLKRRIEDAGPLAERIVGELGVGEGVGSMLALDCTGGYLPAAIAKRTNLSITVADSSASGISAGRALMDSEGLSDRVTFVQTSAMDLQLEDGFFDWVVSADALGTWPNPQTGIEECVRCLKTGGSAFLTWGDRNTYRDYFGMLMALDYPRFALHRDGEATWISIQKLEVEKPSFGFMPGMH